MAVDVFKDATYIRCNCEGVGANSGSISVEIGRIGGTRGGPHCVRDNAAGGGSVVAAGTGTTGDAARVASRAVVAPLFLAVVGRVVSIGRRVIRSRIRSLSLVARL